MNTEGPNLLFEVEKFHIHEGYRVNPPDPQPSIIFQTFNNLAILELKQAANIFLYTPVCLGPPQTMNFDWKKARTYGKERAFNVITKIKFFSLRLGYSSCSSGTIS